MNIELELQPSETWLDNLTTQFSTKSVSTTGLFLDDTNGRHIALNSIKLEKDALLFMGEVCCPDPLFTSKKGSNDYLTLIFFRSKGRLIHSLRETNGSIIIKKAFNSILFFSSEKRIDTEWPKDKMSRFVAINFSKDWLSSKLGKGKVEMSDFFTLLSSKTGIYESEIIPSDRTLFMDDFFCTDNEPISHLKIKAKCFQLIADFLEAVRLN